LSIAGQPQGGCRAQRPASQIIDDMTTLRKRLCSSIDCEAAASPGECLSFLRALRRYFRMNPKRRRSAPRRLRSVLDLIANCSVSRLRTSACAAMGKRHCRHGAYPKEASGEARRDVFQTLSLTSLEVDWPRPLRPVRGWWMRSGPLLLEDGEHRDSKHVSCQKTYSPSLLPMIFTPRRDPFVGGVLIGGCQILNHK
jgi:hypothetical protein